jgi:hypothetical protein
MTVTEKHSTATEAELLNMAAEIFKKAKKSNIDDQANCKKILDEIKDEYNNFYISFYCVVTAMVYFHEYYTAVFKKYLKLYNSEVSSGAYTEEKNIELNITYYVMNFRTKCPHVSEEDVRRYKLQMRESIEEDKVKMKQVAEMTDIEERKKIITQIKQNLQ